MALTPEQLAQLRTILISKEMESSKPKLAWQDVNAIINGFSQQEKDDFAAAILTKNPESIGSIFNTKSTTKAQEKATATVDAVLANWGPNKLEQLYSWLIN